MAGPFCISSTRIRHPDGQTLKRLAISRDDLASWQDEMEEAVENAQGMLEVAG